MNIYYNSTSTYYLFFYNTDIKTVNTKLINIQTSEFALRDVQEQLSTLH